jgi:hypothetical protein
MNDELSIAIPTFNRPEILYENLLFQLPELKKYEIGVYISDDSTNNETEKVVEELSAEYSNIFYFKNNPSLGHDKNFLSTLELPSTNYVWLLGDSMTIKSGSIENVLSVIKINSPSIIGVNYKNRIRVNDELFRSGLKKELETIFINFGWHLTLTGATIYSKDVIRFATNLDLVACRNFPQISLIFEYLNEHLSFFWVENNLLISQSRKKSYWSGNILDVFIHDLSEVIYKLPKKYGLESKKQFIRSHSKESKLFSIRNLVKMRFYGELDSKIVLQNKNPLTTFTHIPYIFVFLISILPRKIIFLYVTVIQYFNKNKV